jgi:diguanylate cyclase (GGDEF)-like protein
MEKMVFVYTFAFLVLLVILISLQNPKQTRNFGHKLFKSVVFFTMLMILIDIGHEYINGVSGSFARLILYLLSFFTYALPSFISLIWFYYVHQLVYYRKPRKGIGSLFLLIPMIVNILIALASVFWPLYFDIDINNIYSRGNIYFLSIIMQYSYLIVAIFMVALNRKKLQDDKFYPLAFFAILPMIGGLIQAFNYGLLLIWPFIAFSIYISFVFIQSRVISTDYLTGLMNKGAFENYIENLKTTNNKNQRLAAVVMDLDGLKSINDNFGHHTGDEVLQSFAKVITQSFNKKDYIARFGGDEFVLITYVHTLEELERNNQLLSNNIKALNEEVVLPVKLNYSLGYDMYNPKKDSTVKQFLERIDQLMYQNKEIKGR